MQFIFKVIIVIFTLITCVNLLTKNYKNIYRLYMVFGKKGSGKSTFLVKQALKYQKKGYTIYTNMQDCMIPNARIFDVELLGKYVPEEKSCVLIDEVGMIWDSRNFKNFKPEVRDLFKLQRHRKLVIFLASQTFDIDKKLRDLTDAMYLTNSIFNVLSLNRRISKKIVLTESTSEAESRIAENLKFRPFWEWKLTYIPKYAKYFDSYIAEELPQLPYIINKAETNSDTHVPRLSGMVHRNKAKAPPLGEPPEASPRPSETPRPPEAKPIIARHLFKRKKEI